ncbi:hypothetical protein [Sulfurimonas sp.]|uniref:hypothetical protein n=1 Tax=Sulfurimonas sp. TaxID=2022749 RepID=UPI0025E3A6C5|nr:hypothetical protein [Sulfurimonas sp.]
MSYIKKIIKAPNLKVNAREHFLVKGLKQPFDVSAIIPIYLHVSENLKKIERDTDMEMDIGRATIIYSVDKHNTIHLISGWVGNRKKAT